MNRNEKILAALQALSERALTEKILIPLLKALGFERVEYSGGPSEQGKDIICWKRDDIGEIELAVVQVKKFRPTRPAGDSRSFQTIINQLSQAGDKSLPHPETQSLHFPAAVYLISPFPLETTVFQSHFESIVAVRRFRIKILDGHKLVSLIDSKLRSFASQLLGVGVLFADAVASHLTNEILLRALDFSSVRTVETFYTEIDLALGQFSSQLLFHANFHPKEKLVRLRPGHWPQFVATREAALKVISTDLILDSIEAVSVNYQRLETEHSLWRSEHDVFLEVCSKFYDIERAVREDLESSMERLRQEGDVAFKNFKSKKEILDAVEKFQSISFSLEKRQLQAPGEEVLKRIEALQGEKEGLELRLGDAVHVLDPLVSTLDTTLQALANAKISVERSSVSEPEVYFEFRINASGLAQRILEMRRSLTARIVLLNSLPPKLEELRRFLLDCHELLGIIHRITQMPELLESLGPIFEIGVERSGDTHLNSGIQRILDTGINLFVLGEAGAGKTTGLQMYAHRKLTLEGSRHLILYIPMARLARLLRSSLLSDEVEQKSHSLLDSIVKFIVSLGLAMTREDFEAELLRGAVILIDGIDEVVGDLPDVLDQLTSLGARFPMVQWVVSARTSGRLSFDLDFTPVTLMPFSDAQRTEFVLKWFGAQEREIANEIIGHLALNKEVSELTKNPLLVTILCVLAEHKVPLPNTEIRLYKDRFDLLMGRYDVYKEAVRLRTRQEYLVLFAQRVAFRLHRERRREVELSMIRIWAVEFLGPDLSAEGCQRAVDELIDPCNVLIPMSADGKLGFGHLRYQEYLSARELLDNRSIDVVSLLDDPWWGDVLLLFARMSSSLGWLLERVRFVYRDKVVPSVVSQMVAVGPVKEKEGLSWLLSDMESHRLPNRTPAS